MIRIPIGQRAAILGPYANRHGLICGATGTGKTYTLATLTEGFSRAGVPVFLCDVKGDLAGMARGGSPVRLLDVFGEQGAAVRVPLQSFGPELLARVLQLTAVQAEVAAAIFASVPRPIDTLADFAGALGARHHGFRATKASVDSIHRALIKFRATGADSFFGRPGFDLATLEARQVGEQGLVSILAADRLIRSPDLYAAFLLWLLAELYARAPEIGDCDRPRLVLIFDEAHLIFREASPALVRRVEQTVRLIRSKAIGVYFASQSPADIPSGVAAMLSNRIQHAMRAATLADRREVQGAADCLPTNPKLRAADLIATMATGRALVSTLDSKGQPTPVELVDVDAPHARMGTLSQAERAAIIGADTVQPSSPAGGPATPVSRKGDGTGYVVALIGLGLLGAAIYAWPHAMALVGCALALCAVIAGVARRA